MKRLLVVALLYVATVSPVWASTRLILLADQDMSPSEMHPNSPQLDDTKHTLDAGVGRGGRPIREGRTISYLRFDLSAIPRPGWFRNVSVDTAALHLFVLAAALTPNDEHFMGKLYLVSVSSCANSNWSESTMTWETRVCKEGFVAQDTKIVDGDALPLPASWDVTQEVERAVSSGLDQVTLIIDAGRLLNCPRDPLEGRGCPDVKRVGFLRFASRERVDFGMTVVPRLVLSYSEHPTSFLGYVSSTLAVLSAIGMLAGLYGAFHRIMRRKGSPGLDRDRSA